MPTICIEGADRVGKSTLIEQIKMEFPFTEVIHFPTKTPPSYKDAMWFMRDFWSAKHTMEQGSLTVLDRCWPSTLVYQDKPDWVDLCKMVFPIDMYILMTIPHGVIFERMDTHSEEVFEAVNKTWMTVNDKYINLMKWDLILDGTDSVEDNIAKIKEAANDKRHEL